ncbi:MAG: retropepsin-like domain-containing protein [Cyanobacteriota bacterium]|nr:retropepsin-like domain-containing protein [Cyanobacteriota bacterium]
MLAWLNQNRQMLLDLYRDRYVAYNADGLIAHGENLKEVTDLARATGQPFLIYLVPRTKASIQILPIQFRAITRHDWQPNYPIKLEHGNLELSTTMLVDSGAEVSLISQKAGRDLGYNLADAEVPLLADTIGGTVEYVLRNVEMTIDEHQITAPVAWLQSPVGGEQLLLGREVVFEMFNIEFRQADEQIIFTWRKVKELSI